jgi:hypothetical protein
MDVEAILKEIRDRVVSEGRANELASGAQPSNGSASHANHSESLTRASAHLAVTSRSWDRLPPVFTNRRGTLARIELWLKRTSRPLTRWFTWEQINFNRAVKDALSDVVEVLKVDAQELAALRAQLAHEARDRRELELRLDAALARVMEIVTSLSDASSSLESKHTQLTNQVIELAAQMRAEDQQSRTDVDRRLTELAAELKDEQRVCFRQLSLSATESAVLEDRARRELLLRLEKLEALLKALAPA